jgi:hypothetical protein
MESISATHRINKMIVTDTEPDEVALAEEAWRVAYRDTCTELCTLFNATCKAQRAASGGLQFELAVFFDGEWFGVYADVPAGKKGEDGFKSIFDDIDPRRILTILQSDDYDPFEVLIKTSPQVAKDWACFTHERPLGCLPMYERL